MDFLHEHHLWTNEDRERPPAREAHKHGGTRVMIGLALLALLAVIAVMITNTYVLARY